MVATDLPVVQELPEYLTRTERTEPLRQEHKPVAVVDPEVASREDPVPKTQLEAPAEPVAHPKTYSKRKISGSHEK